ncbi:hypothetical protein Efla_000732 [Eimeria flavescens]
MLHPELLDEELKQHALDVPCCKNDGIYLPPQIAYDTLNDAYLFRYLGNLPQIASEREGLWGAYTLPPSGAGLSSRPSPPRARTRRRPRPRALRWGTHSTAPLQLALTLICPARRNIYISTLRTAARKIATATARARPTPRTPRRPLLPRERIIPPPCPRPLLLPQRSQQRRRCTPAPLLRLNIFQTRLRSWNLFSFVRFRTPGNTAGPSARPVGRTRPLPRIARRSSPDVLP